MLKSHPFLIQEWFLIQNTAKKAEQKGYTFDQSVAGGKISAITASNLDNIWPRLSAVALNVLMDIHDGVS